MDISNFHSQAELLRGHFERLNADQMKIALKYLSNLIEDFSHLYGQVTQADTIVEILYCPSCSIVFHTRELLDEHFMECSQQAEDLDSPLNSSPRRSRRKRSDPRKSADSVQDDSDWESESLNPLSVEPESPAILSEDPDSQGKASTFTPTRGKRRKTVPRARDVNCKLVTDFKGDERFQCDQCELKFSYYAALLRHLDTIHKSIDAAQKIQEFNKKAVACEECGAVLSSKGALTAHMQMHSGAQPFECDTCGKKFSLKSNLLRHVRIHRGVKPYACDICTKRFTEKRSVEVHRRIHTGERPYRCGVCDMRFGQLGSWIGHQETHKQEKGETEGWACDECGKVLAQKNGLYNHKKRYHEKVRKHACDHCTKAFYTQEELRLHTTTHTGQKAFLCEDCGKSFARNQTFKNHVAHCQGFLAASGRIPCPYCSLKFPNETSFKRHISTYHNPDTANKNSTQRPDESTNYTTLQAASLTEANISGLSGDEVLIYCNTSSDSVQESDSALIEAISKSQLFAAAESAM